MPVEISNPSVIRPSEINRNNSVFNDYSSTPDTSDERVTQAIEAAFCATISGAMSIMLALINQLANHRESLTTASTYPTANANASTHAKWHEAASAFWFFIAFTFFGIAVDYSLMARRESKESRQVTERTPLLSSDKIV